MRCRRAREALLQLPQTFFEAPHLRGEPDDVELRLKSQFLERSSLVEAVGNPEVLMRERLAQLHSRVVTEFPLVAIAPLRR